MGAAEYLNDSEYISSTLESKKAGERLKFLYENYGDRVVASTSFGLQAAVMLHLISQYSPKIPVIFVDTGYLFPETYSYIQQIEESLDVDLRVYHPTMSAARQESLYGKLWEQGEDGAKKYAYLNKVEPMNRAISEIGADIWLSGLRRSQSTTRANRPYSEVQSGLIKAYPILDWADAQIAGYFYDNKLPKHPLEQEGYVTMGDWHSTIPLEQGMSVEETRFGGNNYECGLHINDFQI